MSTQSQQDMVHSDKHKGGPRGPSTGKDISGDTWFCVQSLHPRSNCAPSCPVPLASASPNVSLVSNKTGHRVPSS